MVDVANKFVPAGTSGLDTFFKILYADRLAKIIPIQNRLQVDIGFSKEFKLGDEYIQTVETRLEHGITYATSTDDAFTLADAVAGRTAPAKVRGNQHVMKTQIGYKAAFAGQEGKQAFGNATKTRVRSMWQSIHKRLEIDLAYGQCPEGIAEVSADNAGGGGRELTITPASWAPGIWAGMLGAYVDVWDTVGVLNGAPPSTIAASAREVLAIDLTNRKVTISGAALTGTANWFITLAGGGGASGTGQVNGTTWQTMVGLDVIARVVSGNLFNVPVGDLWQANVVSAGSADFTFPVAQDSLAVGVPKGLDGPCKCYVAAVTFGNMISDQGALRRYDQSQKSSQYQVGAKELEFHSSNGSMTVSVYTLCKQGNAYIFQADEFMRVGSTDVTFNRANMGGAVSGAGETFFREIDTKAGFELRAYSDQALFTDMPGHVITVRDIVNS